MGGPDFCEKKCPICTQPIEMLATFGGWPPFRPRWNPGTCRANMNRQSTMSFLENDPEIG